MMFFDPPMFLLIHVVLSVLGILFGLVVVGGLMSGARLDGWTALFLIATVLTSVTGFGFPFVKVTPAHVVGAISLLVLALCLIARYGKKMAGGWRGTYVVTAVVALYLNVFVLITQLFVKTPALANLAPTQSEPPFTITQGLVLLLFVWFWYAAQRGFRHARLD
ncbi:MAG TPA: hypothetical protein VML58_09450 [Burkholderiaceae bacterium]|nr:hypothetical protein [Burkholderiaceae bacterium]